MESDPVRKIEIKQVDAGIEAPEISPGTPQELGDLPLDLQGSYSSLKNEYINGNKHTYLKDENGKAHVISRADFEEKYGNGAKPDLAVETDADSKPEDEEVQTVSGLPDEGDKGERISPKSWTEMTDDEQHEHLKSKLRPGEYIVKDEARDTWVIEKRKSEAEKQKELVEDWATAEYNKDDKANKEAQDAVQEYLIDAVKRGIMTDDEAVSQIDRLWAMKEEALNPDGRERELRQSLADRLSQLIEDRDNEAEFGTGVPDIVTVSDEDDGGDIDPIIPLTDERRAAIREAEERGLLDTINLPEQLTTLLDRARQRYIELSAKRRGSSFGRGKGELEAAEGEYFRLRDEAGAKVAKVMEEIGLDAERIQAWSKIGAMLEIQAQAQGIRDIHLEGADGKRMRGFYDWWARQDTSVQVEGGRFKQFTANMKESLRPKNLSKTLKKMAALSPIAVAAVPLGIAGAAILGPVAGGAMGLAIASRIGKGLAIGRVNKNANAATVADVRARADIQEGYARINAADGSLSTEELSGATRARTEDIRQGNRSRMYKSAAVGAVLGGVGAAFGDVLSGPGAGAEPRVPGIDPENGRPPQSVTEALENQKLQDEIPTKSGPGPESIPSVVPKMEMPDDIPTPEVPTDFPGPEAFQGYQYPWSWAEDQFGGDPRVALNEMAERARLDGHTVEWHNAANGNPGDDWLEIDGVSSGPEVISILNRYRS